MPTIDDKAKENFLKILDGEQPISHLNVGKNELAAKPMMESKTHKQKIYSRKKKYIGTMVIAIGSIIGLVLVANLISGKIGFWSFLWMGFLFSLLPIALGSTSLDESKMSPEKLLEKKILSLAKENKGMMTVAILAEKTELTVSEAKERLDLMLKSGACIQEMHETGIVYVFSTAGDKS